MCSEKKTILKKIHYSEDTDLYDQYTLISNKYMA